MKDQENSKRRALGRGLEELFYNEPINYNKVEEKIITETPKEEIIKVKIYESYFQDNVGCGSRSYDCRLRQ